MPEVSVTSSGVGKSPFNKLPIFISVEEEEEVLDLDLDFFFSDEKMEDFQLISLSFLLFELDFLSLLLLFMANIIIEPTAFVDFTRLKLAGLMKVHSGPTFPFLMRAVTETGTENNFNFSCIRIKIG